LNIEYDTSNDRCYVCGKGNQQGLKLDFEHDPERDAVFTWCSFPEHMQGYDRIVHGGFVGMLLDEVMAKVCLHCGLKAVTARMETRYSSPVYVGEKLRFSGIIEEVRGRRVRTSALCEDQNGSVRATATALFIRSGT
jgi:acyl-coenzyme A thioesterase PaaI-like protein